MSTPIIRGLTLWRPWAAAIVHGPKRVENRPWAPPGGLVSHGLWLAIHAGKRWDADSARDLYDIWGATRQMVPPSDRERESAWPPLWTEQGIVGVARVERAARIERLGDHTLDNLRGFAFGPWCWLLDQVRALPKAIPCRGAQGLWPLPPDVLAVIEPLCVEPAS